MCSGEFDGLAQGPACLTAKLSRWQGNGRKCQAGGAEGRGKGAVKGG